MADLDKVLEKAKELLAEGKHKKGLGTIIELLKKEANFQSHGSKIMNILIDAGKQNPTITFPELAKAYKSGANDISRKRLLSLFTIFIQDNITTLKFDPDKIDEWNPWFPLVYTLQKSKSQDILQFAIMQALRFFEQNKLEFIKNYHWLAKIIAEDTIKNAEYKTIMKIFDFFKELCYADSSCNDYIMPVIKKKWKSDVAQIQIEVMKIIGNLSLYNIQKFEDFVPKIQKLLDEKNLNLRSFIVQALGRFGFSAWQKLYEKLDKVIRITFYPPLIPAITKVLALHIQDHPGEILNNIRGLYEQKKYKPGIINLLNELIKVCPNRISDDLIDYLISIEKNKKILPKLHDLKNVLRHYNLSFRICPRCFSENALDDEYCDFDRFPLIPGLPLPPIDQLPEKGEEEHFDEVIEIDDEVDLGEEIIVVETLDLVEEETEEIPEERLEIKEDEEDKEEEEREKEKEEDKEEDDDGKEEDEGDGD